VSGHEEILVILAVIVIARLGLIARAWQQARHGHTPGPRPRSTDRTRRCRTGKVPFESKADADRVVRRSQTERREGYDRPLERSHRCPRCGRWHTTSQHKRAPLVAVGEWRHRVRAALVLVFVERPRRDRVAVDSRGPGGRPALSGGTSVVAWT
jgi:hypothetical protein